MKKSAVLIVFVALNVVQAYSQDAPATTPETSPAVLEELRQLRAEVTALRAQVDKLQSTFDVYVNGTVAELQDENTRLRRQLRRAYGDEPEAALVVPTPDQDAVEQALTVPEPETPPPAEQPAPLPETAFKTTTITEWGRSVEDSQRLGDKAQSLKGMILAVPPGSTDRQLRDLARTLRKTYDAYDNINIEVFEGADAAKSYAAGNGAAAQHRVLSISKHAASGRDTAVLIRGDRTEPIDLTAP